MNIDHTLVVDISQCFQLILDKVCMYLISCNLALRHDLNCIALAVTLVQSFAYLARCTLPYNFANFVASINIFNIF